MILTSKVMSRYKWRGRSGEDDRMTAFLNVKLYTGTEMDNAFSNHANY